VAFAIVGHYPMLSHGAYWSFFDSSSSPCARRKHCYFRARSASPLPLLVVTHFAQRKEVTWPPRAGPSPGRAKRKKFLDFRATFHARQPIWARESVAQVCGPICDQGHPDPAATPSAFLRLEPSLNVRYYHQQGPMIVMGASSTKILIGVPGNEVCHATSCSDPPCSWLHI